MGQQVDLLKRTIRSLLRLFSISHWHWILHIWAHIRNFPPKVSWVNQGWLPRFLPPHQHVWSVHLVCVSVVLPSLPLVVREARVIHSSLVPQQTQTWQATGQPRTKYGLKKQLQCPIQGTGGPSKFMVKICIQPTCDRQPWEGLQWKTEVS